MSGEFYFTSDTHFGHRLITDLRGFDSIEEHDAAIIQAWNDRVKPGDVVFHLGDFMLPFNEERAKEILRQLNGTKQLIIGNHDTGKLREVKGWAWTGHLRARHIAGEKIVLCHYALRSWPAMGHGSMHLYGHSHGNLAPDYGRSMDVGVDTRADMAPWRLDEVVELIGQVPVLIVDHHDENEGEEFAS